MTLLGILIYLAAALVIIVCVSMEIDIIRGWLKERRQKQMVREVIENLREKNSEEN
ncbi:hypothetical protein [Salinicoccus roseus]|uniref:Viral protein U n=1 Tax=Salinicoccus roseus TaxID=45670 RepID=A0ABT4YKK3_9STAP|nr:hypothetical protein [Salinicoccus roseus]MDB0581219.1 hypothetical protein [Salinicoccus roseus]